MPSYQGIELEEAMWPSWRDKNQSIKYLVCPTRQPPAGIRTHISHWIGQETIRCSICSEVARWRGTLGIPNTIENSYNIPPDNFLENSYNIPPDNFDLESLVQNVRARIEKLNNLNS